MGRGGWCESVVDRSCAGTWLGGVGLRTSTCRCGGGYMGVKKGACGGGDQAEITFRVRIEGGGERRRGVTWGERRGAEGEEKGKGPAGDF